MGELPHQEFIQKELSDIHNKSYFKDNNFVYNFSYKFYRIC